MVPIWDLLVFCLLRNCNNLIGMVRLEIRFGMCNELKIDDEKKRGGGLLKFLFPKQINMVNETVSSAEECVCTV